MSRRFWVQEGDERTFDSGDGGLRRKEVTFTIHGNPAPMQRPRVNFRNHSVYSPSFVLLREFKNLIKASIIPPEYKGLLFNSCDEKVEVDMTFRMQRPLYHFVGNSRNNALKETYLQAGPSFTTAGGDIDNLGKFVLDSLEGTIYYNDKQVTRTVMQKVWDDEGGCNGSAAIRIVGLTQSL